MQEGETKNKLGKKGLGVPTPKNNIVFAYYFTQIYPKTPNKLKIIH